VPSGLTSDKAKRQSEEGRRRLRAPKALAKGAQRRRRKANRAANYHRPHQRQPWTSGCTASPCPLSLARWTSEATIVAVRLSH
jgi:hypothetical protein